EGNVLPGSVVISSPPAHGTAVANGDGTVTYTLTEPWFASDSFEYTIQDDQIPTAISAPATVSITITPPILTVAKDASQSQAVLDDVIEFFIYVINDGPGTAYSVDLSDSLGSCFQWEAGSPDGLLGDLADGAAVVVGPVSARVINTSGCSNENRASVTSINGASASGSVTITLISGTRFPLFFPLLVFAWPLLRTVYRKIRRPF
ncbi:MAG: Ig-like domain-containing protein, partial [Anaerolineales bacterium]